MSLLSWLKNGTEPEADTGVVSISKVPTPEYIGGKGGDLPQNCTAAERLLYLQVVAEELDAGYKGYENDPDYLKRVAQNFEGNDFNDE